MEIHPIPAKSPAGRAGPLFPKVDCAVWEWDPRGHFTYVGFQVRALLGYAPEEILGRSAFDFVAPAHLQRTMERLSPLLSGHLAFRDIETVHRHKAGNDVVLSASGEPDFDADGRYLGYHGTLSLAPLAARRG